MLSRFSHLFLIVFLLAAAEAYGQIDASTPSGRPRQQEPLPKNVQETLAKQRIEREKKDYAELLEKSEEAVKLSQELEKSFALAKEISAEDRKKLERLEKLIKKIRSELGGDDDGEKEEKSEETGQQSSTLGNALQNLQSNAVNLFNEIKKSTRYSISVVAIQTSNSLLKIVKFIRLSR